MPASDAAVTGQQRAIVWMPVGTVAPPPLLDSLKKRDVALTLVHSELVALAHAAANHNNGSLRAGTLVVLCEASKLPKIAETIIAMRRYASSAVVYVYQPNSKTALREVTDQDLVDWGAPSRRLIHRDPAQDAPPVIVPPAGSMRLVGASSGQVVRDDAPAADVLSADELSMLLGRNGRGDR